MDKASLAKLKPGIKTKRHDPNKLLRNQKFIAQSLVQAILESDKEAFLEILEGHIKAKNISEVARQTGLRRSTIYSAIQENYD